MQKPYLKPADYLRDNPFAERHYYKIYHDGSHPVGTRVLRSKGKLPPKRPAQTAFDIAFDSLYFQAKRKGLKDEEMADYIQAGLEKLYPASSALRKYILEKMDKKQRNLWKRIKRFKRKMHMNKWNYFVTFTCDPKKHTEESFREKSCVNAYLICTRAEDGSIWAYLNTAKPMVPFIFMRLFMYQKGR